MEFRSTSSKKFLKATIKLLKENKEILTLIRHPNRSGAKDYLFFTDENNFIDFIKKLEIGDSLTIFKPLSYLWRGELSSDSIPNIINEVEKYNNQWLLVIENNSYQTYLEGKNQWTFTETLEELEEELRENFKHKITVLLEPDFCDESNTLHAYAPNKYGVGKALGSY